MIPTTYGFVQSTEEDIKAANRAKYVRLTDVGAEHPDPLFHYKVSPSSHLTNPPTNAFGRIWKLNAALRNMMSSSASYVSIGSSAPMLRGRRIQRSSPRFAHRHSL